MGANALEQEPCDDCVSRRAVLEIQAKYAEHMGATKFWQMRDNIKALPPAQPEIVRCKDCKHREAENGFCEGRGWPMQLVPDDGFCEKGERRRRESR